MDTHGILESEPTPKEKIAAAMEMHGSHARN